MSYAAARQRRYARGSAGALAQGLGWFSIGLGLTELLAPHLLSRALGMRGQERLVATYGLREIAAGVGILASRDPTPWIWGRVAGDALDVATLVPALDRRNRQRGNAGLAMAAVLGATALDLICAYALHRETKEEASRRRPRLVRDYGNRTGFPHGVEAARGAARDFEAPRDFRIPEPLRPWTTVA